MTTMNIIGEYYYPHVMLLWKCLYNQIIYFNHNNLTVFLKEWFKSPNENNSFVEEWLSTPMTEAKITTAAPIIATTITLEAIQSLLYSSGYTITGN